MPQITSIEPQKRKSNRFNVYLDGKFAFAASDLLILKNDLKTGKSLKEEEIKEIISKDELAKLTDLAVRFLSLRPRSENEVRIYLTKKIAARQNLKFSQAKESIETELVISKLKKYKYLNDLEFTKWLVQSRVRSNPKGKIALKYELKQKGIESELIEKVLENMGSEKNLAIKSVEKKLKRWQNLSSVRLKTKIYQHLTLRGFSPETIKETFAFFLKKS